LPGWDAWLTGAAGSFAVLEATTLATGGSPLTTYLRQLGGLKTALPAPSPRPLGDPRRLLLGPLSTWLPVSPTH
jgi:hypothetical protein